MTHIYTALANVMAEVDHVAKRDRNEHQKFLFRGIDAVVNAVGPALRNHGVIVVPMVDSITYDNVMTSNNKPASACRVVASYVFYAEDGSSITTKVAGEAWDHGDKATPKAMSVAFRTALLQALALPTDEPDADSQTYEQAAGGAAAPPPDPVGQARSHLADVWRRTHGGALDPAEVAAAFEAFASGTPFAQATPGDIARFAQVVEHEYHEATAAKFVDQPAGQLPPPTTETKPAGTGPVSQGQMRMLMAVVAKAGISEEEVHAWISGVIGRDITSRSELTKADASKVIDYANSLIGGAR